MDYLKLCHEEMMKNRQMIKQAKARKDKKFKPPILEAELSFVGLELEIELDNVTKSWEDF